MVDVAQVLQRYGETVPRYTSYPPAPHWQDGLGPKVQAELLAAARSHGRVSVYLHIPFCDRLCWFCGCHTKQTRRYEPVVDYVDSLVAEIGRFGRDLAMRPHLCALHLGGGSPSLLRSAEMKRIRAALEASFNIDDRSEIAVEIDPSDMNDDAMEGLAALGLTRASIGVQDFDPGVQAAINRPQSAELTAAIVDRLREETGCTVNIDALYGLPQQNRERLMRTIERIVTMAPERIALFGYAHMPRLKRHQTMIAESDLPDTEERLTSALSAADLLARSGYETIGFDHFALPHDTMALAARQGRLYRNFQGYTTDDAPVLLGFGASAISRWPGGYMQNIVPTGLYRGAIAEGHVTAARGYILSADDRMRAHAIERLLCDMSLDLAALQDDFGEAGPFVGALRKAVAMDGCGLAQIEGDMLRIAPENRIFSRIVASWMDAHAAASEQRRYSRAV